MNSPQTTITRRAWLAQAGLLGISLVQPHRGWAAGPGKKKPAAKGAPKTHYLVSAILREDVQGFTFRLVHSVQTAASVDEATGLFMRLVLEKYPGHAIAQTTVTDIVLPPDACPANRPTGPTRPRKPFPTLYIVSAVMSDGGNSMDILLVNGWLPGRSADEALGRVLRDVSAKYPAFAPAKTLVTVLDPALVGCAAPAPMRLHGERV